MKTDYGSPQLQGIVIITLPPPDNPSLGKTITAFTLSEDSPPQPEESHQAPSQNQAQHPQQIPNDQFHQLSLRRSLFGRPISVLGFLGISLITLLFWASVSQETLFELSEVENDKDDKSDSTFIFPLYPKPGVRHSSVTDVELKLGRFVDFSAEKAVETLNDGISHRKIALSASASSKIDSATILPVKGNIYPDGLYYTYMLVGNPPRPYFLDVDSGSDLTWIQCDAPCTSCAKGAHPFYKPTKGNLISSKDSFCDEVQKNQRTKYCETCYQCDYEIEYADHSSSFGVLARDQLHLVAANRSLIKSNIVLGCAYDQQGLLLNTLARTDGILGISRARISLSSQLASQGIINNVVGHCLSTNVKGGGYVFFGDDFVPHWQMSWVPMLNSPFTHSYHTELEKMSYGGKEINVVAMEEGIAHVIFDSGSSYTYFTKQAYNDLVAMLKNDFEGVLIQDASDATLPICWQANFPIRSIADVKQFFKPLNFQFGSKWRILSTQLQIPPESYLIRSDKGNVCLGILDGSNILGGSTFMLGDISLRGQLFVYDNVKQKIGWIKSNCVRPRQFETLPFS